MAILQECPKCKKRATLKRLICRCGYSFPSFGRILWVDITAGENARKRVRLGQVGLSLAREKEGEIKRELRIARGHPGLPTWREIKNQYLARLAAEEAHPRYQANARRFLDRMIEQWGHFKITDLTPSLVRFFQVNVRARGFSPAYVNQHIAVGKAAWTFATDLPNPFKKTKLYRLNNELTRYLSGDERHRILVAAEIISRDLYEMIVVAMGTGLRKGNIINLRRDETDFESGTVTVRQKGGSPLTIPMNREIVKLLEKIPPNGTPWFWVSKITRQPYHKDWRRSWKKVLAVAGITRPFRFHDLRHDTGTRIVSLTGNIRLAQKMLGHRQISTTLRYAHVLPEDLRAVSDKLVTKSKKLTK